MTDYIGDQLDFEITPANEPFIHRVIVISMVAYGVLMAIPFVPAAEIGFSIILLLGPKIAPLVYICTIFSLGLSFCIGRLIPERSLIRFLKKIGFSTFSNKLKRLEGLDSHQRLTLLIRTSPKKLLAYFIRHRYLAVILLINLPGNIVLGGGGGIALIAGFSRLFKAYRFLLAIAIAASPVPIAILFFGDTVFY